MKTKLIFFLLLTFNLSLSSQEIYDNFYKFKAELYNTASEKMEISIAEYREKTEKMQISEEEKLTLENFLVLEELNVLNRDNSNKKKIFLKLKTQNDKSTAFMQGKKNSQAGKWFLLSWADIKSQYIGFLSGQDVYKEANDTKLLYVDALKKDKKFAPASISYGLWMFFAPPIAGGGYENSLKEFSKAVSNAKNNYEKYLALIFRSQVYFALENEASSKKDLKAAAGLIADENFSLVVEELNKNDQIFFKK
ncbi:MULTISPECIES: hypothetical protein [unclassified Treponema]|uniref:hypothetical protein n=1 Tax=unclassified Treponema TaxID=2638727 RepID=UPI0020A47367|nr:MULTISPECIES: hypothetical protein [unclassified Treponema]UTC66715.1 hypothetical protein E4O06_12265 [Treponema sp. OMZ 789]UTC69447.1 hypothetical protein E4O01_12405 [Treponema sp. OMZ 790]UTC72161.1 hypothetical protein E4O02_12500 [Treponema sp. OMZ 791]